MGLAGVSQRHRTADPCHCPRQCAHAKRRPSVCGNTPCPTGRARWTARYL